MGLMIELTPSTGLLTSLFSPKACFKTPCNPLHPLNLPLCVGQGAPKDAGRTPLFHIGLPIPRPSPLHFPSGPAELLYPLAEQFTEPEGESSQPEEFEVLPNIPSINLPPRHQFRESAEDSCEPLEESPIILPGGCL